MEGPTHCDFIAIVATKGYNPLQKPDDDYKCIDDNWTKAHFFVYLNTPETN